MHLGRGATSIVASESEPRNDLERKGILVEAGHYPTRHARAREPVRLEVLTGSDSSSRET